ncbi:MAG: NAD(P)H-hydrate dehydratase [Anaerocolumna sp.]|jgi:phosphopantetheine--protein transferase-like protein|nr:NAD(P)H-hydrate dehydratase [Anaerocolumna sp.]
MLHGTGTDIIKIDHLKPFLERLDDPFIQKTYTSSELELILSRPTPLNSLATRFAGKEAVFKCLGVHGNTVLLNEIEILENTVGQPTVTLLGKAKDTADHLGIVLISISLSYDTDYAIAFAVSEKI